MRYPGAPGDADHVLSVLRGFKDTTPLTDIVHPGPAAGLSIRGEAYRDLKGFAEKVLPALKSW